MAERRGDVLAAWVHSEEVAYSWFESMLAVVMSSPRIGPYFAMKCGTDGLVAARNKVAAQFLASDADWLWWIDTDMGFKANTLDALLKTAHPAKRPVVGALCFANRELRPDGMGGYRCTAIPTLYQWGEREDGASGFVPMLDYPADSVVPVAGTGSACIVIHRSVLEDVADKFGPVWYERLKNPTTGQLIGEDLSFCYRAVAAGHVVHVDTSVKTTHLKPVWLQEADFRGGLTP